MRPLPRQFRRRTWIAGIGALVVVVAIVAGALAAGTRPAPAAVGAPSRASLSPIAAVASASAVDDEGDGAVETDPADGYPEPVSPSEPAPSAMAGVSCDPRTVPSASAPPAEESPATAVRPTLRVPVLMYHRVIPPAQAGNSLPGLVVPPDLFAAQMAALASAGWHTATLASVAHDLEAGRTPPPHTFVISFDDGREDGYTYAFPVLQSHGFVATYFVIPGHIGHPTDLTPEQLPILVAAGNEIADHSMDHVDLRAITPAHLKYEVEAAAQKIAGWTGRWPETFAYPFGKFNPAVIDAVHACAPILMAVTTVPGVQETWNSRYEVPRIRVTPGTTPAALVAALRPYE